MLESTIKMVIKKKPVSVFSPRFEMQGVRELKSYDHSELTEMPRTEYYHTQWYNCRFI